MMKQLFTYLFYFGTLAIANGQNCLDVNFKLRGYFYVGTSDVDTTALGGFYEDPNVPRKITGKIKQISTDKTFEIIVRTDMTAEFEKGISGFKVFIVNRSDSTMVFAAEDSRLSLRRQVFYQGAWKDIEYLPNSWCGNSYHNVSIRNNEYWDLTAPCIEGKIQAKFRFELYVDKNLKFYSNEFEGSFNKKQLKKEQGYRPRGLMDPYNN